MKKDSSQGRGGVRTPCTLPLDPPLTYIPIRWISNLEKIPLGITAIAFEVKSLWKGIIQEREFLTLMLLFRSILLA